MGGPSSGETGRVLSEGTQYRVYLKTKKNSVKKQKPLKEMGVTRCTGGNVRRSSEGSGCRKEEHVYLLFFKRMALILFSYEEYMWWWWWIRCAGL